jgi:hypothetical protein
MRMGLIDKPMTQKVNPNASIAAAMPCKEFSHAHCVCSGPLQRALSAF